MPAFRIDAAALDIVFFTDDPKFVTALEPVCAAVLSDENDVLSDLMLFAAVPAPDAASVILLTPVAVAVSVAPRSSTPVSLVSPTTAPASFSKPVPAFSAASPIESKIPATAPKTPSTPPEMASMTCVMPSETVVIVPSTVSPTLVTILLISSELLVIVVTSSETASTTLEMPVHARSTPAPISSIAVPNATKPSAPAVNAGPHRAATPISAAMPTAMPPSTAIAGVPASVMRIAASTSTEIAWAAIYSAAAAPIILTAPAAALTNAPPAASTGAVAPAAAPPSPPILPTSPPMPPAIVEMPPMTLPPISSKGPATAAIPATFRIISCISGDRPFHASETPSTPLETLSSMSTSMGPADSTISAPSDLRSLIVVWNSSIGLIVPSNASETLPLVSVAAVARSSKLSVPFWIAP